MRLPFYWSSLLGCCQRKLCNMQLVHSLNLTVACSGYSVGCNRLDDYDAVAFCRAGGLPRAAMLGAYTYCSRAKRCGLP